MKSATTHNITVEDNLNLVWEIIHKRFGGGTSFRRYGFEQNDLFQAGTEGLILAVKRFDPSFECQFATFATSYIVGYILRELRDNGRAIRFPRTVKEIVNKITKQDKSKNVNITIDEVMEKFGVEYSYANMVLACLYYSPISGDDVVYNDDITLFDTMSDDSANVEEKVIKSIELEQRLSVLSESDKHVVELSLKGLTQREIGGILGVSQTQISRAIKRSIKKIEKRFDRRF